MTVSVSAKDQQPSRLPISDLKEGLKKGLFTSHRARRVLRVYLILINQLYPDKNNYFLPSVCLRHELPSV